MTRCRLTIRHAWTGLVLALAVVGTAAAQRIASDLPPEMQGVEVIERLNEQVPLDLEFIDENGNVVKLGDYFQSGKPVILTLNYYTCPMLCHLTLNGLVDGLRDVEMTAGKDFEIVTVSINPDETPEQASMFKRRYLSEYDRAGADWHFLCDKDGNVKKLADAVGYGYRFVPQTGEYAHSSVIKFVTPDGRISRYINNVVFAPRDLRLALVESSQGGIGSSMDRLLLFMCFAYDPDSNSYSASAWKIMRTGGALTVVLVGVGVFVLWKAGSNAEHTAQSQETEKNGIAKA